jgi:uncharacterized protein (UPF0332 family)
MKPESTAFLEKSHELLAQAEAMLNIGLIEPAGRTAYLAGFHAAQALIFEKQERVLKTHSGVQSEFGRLVKEDPRIGLDLRAFLGRTYQLKTIADYETGAGSKVTAAQATEAIAAARRFIAAIASLIADNGEPQ